MPGFLACYGAALASVLMVSAVSADPLMRGREVYQGTCIACHGADGTGALPGVPDFTAKDSPLGNPDEVLVERMMNGFQSSDSPMAMPAKGGNPALTREDIEQVLRYMRKTFGGT